ncbi:MAG: carboxymuconolactone decarboxylase family protein [Rhodospirillales bacterium]
MKHFEVYTPENAPTPSDAMLKGLQDKLGFVPNVFAVMGGTPPVLSSFVALNEKYAQTSLSTTEREIVEIAVSVENGCAYCVAGHTAFAKMQNVPDDVITAVRSRGIIDNPKLAALHDFVRVVVTKRGHIETEEMDRFLAAGYSPAQVQEVILGVCVKTFSNLTSVMLDIPLDAAFTDFVWDPAEANTTRRAA